MDAKCSYLAARLLLIENGEEAASAVAVRQIDDMMSSADQHGENAWMNVLDSIMMLGPNGPVPDETVH